MSKKRMLQGLSVVFGVGLLVELVTAETPESADEWLALATGTLLVVVVAGAAAQLTLNSSWLATIVAAIATGLVTGIVFTLGLYLPFALAIGDRDPGQFPPGPGDWTVVDMVVAGGFYGAFFGVLSGALALLTKLWVLRRRSKGAHAI